MWTLGLCCLWTASSVGATVANKLLANSSVGPLGVTLVQSLVASVVAIPAACCAGQMPTLDRRFWLWATVTPVLFILGVGGGIMALQRASLATWVVLRNTEPILAAMLETMCPTPHSRFPDRYGVLALVAIAGGALIYEWPSLSGDGVGQNAHLVAGVVALTAVTRLTQARLLPQIVAPRTTLVCFTNVIGSAYLCGILALADRQTFRALADVSAPWRPLLLGCVPSTMMAFGSVHVQTRLSATQMATLACFSKLLLVVCSIVYFKERLGPFQSFGVALSLAACVTYALTQSNGASTDPGRGGRDHAYSAVPSHESADSGAKQPLLAGPPSNG